MTTVTDVMTRNVRTLTPSDTVASAAKAMGELNVGVIPVCEGDKLLGVVTDRDIVVRAVAQGLDGHTPLAKVMAKEPVTVTPATPVTEVVKMMYERKFGSVPVVEGEKLVGIVTTTDLLGLLSKLLGT